jgi:hypothetical protein
MYDEQQLKSVQSQVLFQLTRRTTRYLSRLRALAKRFGGSGYVGPAFATGYKVNGIRDWPMTLKPILIWGCRLTALELATGFTRISTLSGTDRCTQTLPRSTTRTICVRFSNRIQYDTDFSILWQHNPRSVPAYLSKYGSRCTPARDRDCASR